MNSLVFDIGGSLLRAGLWNTKDKALVARADCPSPGLDQSTAEAPVERLIESLRSLAERLVDSDQPPVSIGIAFPGPVDAQGRVGQAATLWGDRVIDAFDFASMVSAALWNRPTRIANDLTAAGMRYALPGHDFCIVTVSSGIGNKVFLDGKPVLGPNHKGGELGHWRVDPSMTAPLCECGGRGHVGALASGRSVPHHFRETVQENPELHSASSLSNLGDLSPKITHEVARAFQGGDAFAQAVVRRCAAPLGSVLANLHLSIGVERFVIVGGFASALGPAYLDLLAESAAQSSWGNDSEWSTRIEAGLDDDDSGLIGMGCLLALEPA